MPRRSFLRRLGLGTATAFVVADGIIAYRAYDQGVLAEGDGPAFDAWAAWTSMRGTEALVGAAVLAASAHNTQPWQFAATSDRIDVFADLARTTGANDPLLRELHVSLGCALENVVLAAAPNGFVADVDVLAAAAGPIATVALRPTTPDGSNALWRAIGDRHSNRSRYRDEPVAGAALAAMSALADDAVARARVVWITDASPRARFAALLRDATDAHVADEEQSRDSFAWWRSDWDAIQRHKDGLTIDGVGLPPLIRSLGKILPATSRAAADRTTVDRTKLQAESAAAFGVVVVDDPSAVSDRLAGGRLLQRLHLWAAANDLGFQHMNQITERIDRDRQLDRTSPFAQPLADLVGEGALAAFRLGTPTVPSVPSPRRPVSEVTR